MFVAERDPDAYVDSAPSSDEVRALLNTDPDWAAYALADLQPDYAPYCHWHVAEGAGGKGLVLVFTRLEPPALFAIGAPDAVARAIGDARMPDTVYALLREEHQAAASRHYDFSADRSPMWRMTLTDPAAIAGRASLPRNLKLTGLGAGDRERILGLYAHGGPFTPGAFDLYQTADGAFYGVTGASGELLAVGGTHVVDWQAGIGAIGNMYTHPAHRGQGLGAAVLSAIVDRLLAGGVSTIVLNVDQRNTAAKRLYERHGFEIYCPYFEGIGYRKSDSGRQ